MFVVEGKCQHCYSSLFVLSARDKIKTIRSDLKAQDFFVTFLEVCLRKQENQVDKLAKQQMVQSKKTPGEAIAEETNKKKTKKLHRERMDRESFLIMCRVDLALPKSKKVNIAF